jgi:hypothetical protein
MARFWQVEFWPDFWQLAAVPLLPLRWDSEPYYQSLKDQEKGPLSRHYLALTQKLMPLRITCARGRIPLGDPPTETEEKIEAGNNDDEDEDSEDAPKKK